MTTPRLPILTKSWQLDVNNVGGTSTTSLADNQATLFAVKNSMVSFSNNPWIVHSSSNASVADTNDNWNSPSDLDWDSAGNFYSWIVLTKPTTVSQLLIDLQSASPTNIRIFWSPGGLYTGGTSSSKPTATDEIILQTATNWNGNLGATDTWVHVWHENTGARTRVLITNGSGDPSAFWILDEITDPFPDNWSNPEIICIFEGVSDVLDPNILSSVPVTNNAALSVDNSTTLEVSIGSIGYEAVPAGGGGDNIMTEQEAGEVGNELSSLFGFPMGPLTLSVSTTGSRGIHGIISDLYWGHQSISHGTTYPNSTTRKQFAQAGGIIFPWTNDDTIPLFDATAAENTVNGQFIGSGSSLDTEVTFFRMVGIDSGAPDEFYPHYVYWTTSFSPDLTGAEAGALPFGGPLSDIAVSFEYKDVQ